jgi:DNA-directed RNA polymerase specialized sigma24 family protein
MKNIHIQEFKEKHTQAEIAAIMGVTQGAVSQALSAGRDIYFTLEPGGKFSYFEVKWPRSKAP